MDRIKSALKYVGVRLFVLAALVSFGYNALHLYERSEGVDHMKYIGSGEVDINGQSVYMAAFDMELSHRRPSFNPMKVEHEVRACVELGRSDKGLVMLTAGDRQVDNTSTFRITPRNVQMYVNR